MPELNVKEKQFEEDIQASLCADGGYVVGDPKAFDRKLALDKATLLEFIKTTQDKAWYRYEKLNGKASEEMLINRFVHVVKQQGLLSVLRNGFIDRGIKFRVVYWKPETGLSATSQLNYDANILHCTRQLHYSLKNENSIDWKSPCYDEDGVLKPFTRNMRKVISKITKGFADVVNYNYLDGTDIADAVNKGVVVYEYNV